MNFTIDNIGIIALILLTGLSAGLCFTWSNSVTPGISRLDNLSYLSAFQQMNRTILNPLFFIVFFGPFFLGLINLYVFKNASSSIVFLLTLAVAIYFLGVVLVTVLGNVPLNEVLDKTDLNNASFEELKSLKEIFDDKWNRFHLIRTITSSISFLILIVIALIMNNN